MDSRFVIFGKDKKVFAELQSENERLKAELKKIKDNAPQIQEVLTFLADLGTLGAALVEIRRIHPDSVFLKSVNG